MQLKNIVNKKNRESPQQKVLNNKSVQNAFKNYLFSVYDILVDRLK
jgi:hypothetical protein